MKSLLLVFLVVIYTVENHGHQYGKPYADYQVNYQLQTAKVTQFGTNIIKGNDGKYYEVTILPSRKMYETHLTTQQQVPAVANQTHLTVINSTPTLKLNRNYQLPFNNQQQHLNLKSNLDNRIGAVDNAQNHYNQFTENSNYQQQQHTQHPQQAGLFFQKAPQQQQARSFIQSAPQQFGTLSHQQADFSFQIGQKQQQQHQQQYYPQQPPCNNNLPNSNNLQNDLVNNHKYISQSEASQLDVPYIQTNANARQYLRIITKCDVAGQCEPLNAGNNRSGVSDFQHQQVLKQSKAQVQPHDNKYQSKFNYQFTGNALTSNAAKSLRGISINKGTDLKYRRLFPYCEVLIPQYPHN